MKRGKPDTSIVYSNSSRGITLRKRNQTKVSDWVIIEDSTGDVIDSGKWRELWDKYEGSPVRQEDYDTVKLDTEASINEALDLGESYERYLSKEDLLLPERGDKVTVQIRDAVGDWSNISPATGKQSEVYTFVKVEEVPTSRKGITSPQYAAGTSKAYTVRSDSKGEEVLEIMPSFRLLSVQLDHLRLVVFLPQ